MTALTNTVKTRLAQVYFLAFRTTPLRFKRWVNDAQLIPDRERVAAQYLKGNGVEVGALHSPLKVPPQAQIKYVDRFSAADLRKHYPELNELEIVDPDIVDDGEKLTTLADNSQDFIIGSHFLEHCEDPIGTLQHHLQKVKPGGLLFYVIPNKHYVYFDFRRTLTSFDHLLADHLKGPEGSRFDHYMEWSNYSMNSSHPEQTARQLMDMKYSIHFHVWNHRTFKTFLEKTQNHLRNSFEIELYKINQDEVIAILKKKS